jgi:hypothetical protein
LTAPTEVEHLDLHTREGREITRDSITPLKIEHADLVERKARNESGQWALDTIATRPQHDQTAQNVHEETWELTISVHRLREPRKAHACWGRAAAQPKGASHE